MLYFANPCGNSDVLEAMRLGRLGYIDTPAQGNRRPHGVRWCADNGCFSSNFDPEKWWGFLRRNVDSADSCSFAVAPDVVGDAAATIAVARPWMPRIRRLGYPVAFVAQDGLEHQDVPWDEFDVLFLGGTTAWKLGRGAQGQVLAALSRGKAVHMGRVNSKKRFEYARYIGCASVDGTFLTKGPRVNLPRLFAWVNDAEAQDLLVGAAS